MKKLFLSFLVCVVLIGTTAACYHDTSTVPQKPLAEYADDRQPQEQHQEEKVPVKSIALNEMSLTLHPGEKYPLRVSVRPDNADTAGLIWFSDDENIVSVSAQGQLKALSEGKTEITVVTPSHQYVSCRVTVYPGAYEEDPEEEDEESGEESKEESKEESDEESKEESQEREESERKYAEAPEITGEAVDTEWFDDAVFIGDSITYGLYNYAENGCLGDADFLAIDCMGYHTAMFDLDHQYGIHPVYNGEKVMIDDAVRDIGRKKVFIMLGMNDISSWGVTESVEAMEEFTDKLLAKSPDIQIYVHSVTPMIAEKDGTRPDYLNNENIVLYNEQIKQICAARGFVYLDLYEVVSDGYGNLRDDYCVDPNNLGFHYNSDGMRAWVDFLKTHVQ